MRFKSLTLSVVLVALLSLAACGEKPSPTTALTVTGQATPAAVTVVATAQATPTEMAVPTKRAPTAAPVEVEEISFQSDHFTVVGDLQIPAAQGMHPAIIMVHGDGGIDRYDSGNYRPIMERFLRAGYAVLSWDKPGTGESTGEFVDGAWIVTDRASILVDAVAFLKGHPAVDPERIGAWGISQGGYVMPMALTMTDDIAFLIVVSGPGMDGIEQFAYLIGQQVLCAGYSEEEASLARQSFAGLARADTYQEYQDNWVALSSVEIPEGISFTGRELTPREDWSPWDRAVDAFFNPIEVIERTTIPVLAFFGEKDRQVDPVQGAQAYEQALQKAGNQNYRVELIPGVGHVLDFAETGCMNEQRRRVYAPEYLELMEEWLVQLSISLPSPIASGGGMIAFVSERDGKAQIYTMKADGSDQRYLTQDGRDHWYPHWSPDGGWIAFHSHESSNVWSIYTVDAQGGAVQRLTDENALDAGPVWSPDGTQIAFDRGWDLWVMNADGTSPRQMTDDPGIDGHADWSPDGSEIVLTSERDGNPEIYVMSVGGGDLRRLTHEDGGDWWPDWSPDGSQIAFKSDRDGDFEIYVVNADGSRLRQLTDNAAEDGEPDWSPDGSRIAFESNREGNFEIYVMDADGGNVQRLTDHPARDIMPVWRPAVELTRTTRGHAAITANTVGQLELLQTLGGHTDRVYGLDFSSDCRLLASASQDGTIRVWDVASRREIQTLAAQGDWDVFFVLDDSHVASTHGRIWNIETGETVRSLDLRQALAAFSPDGARMASAGYNAPIELWDVETGEVVQTLEGHTDRVFGMAFSPDGALLASGSGMGPSDTSDYAVKLWDLESGRELHALHGHSGDIHAVAFSPDGSLLASASTDYTVRVWDVPGGELVRTLWHADGLWDVAFSPDGALLASAGVDRQVRLWDVASGQLSRSLRHGDELMAVAFSPDGSLLAAAGYDNLVYLWGVPCEDSGAG